jgi:hypothetical protein
MTAVALAWWFLGWGAVGYLVSEARERWYWQRMAIRTFTSAPMSTQMPTVAELPSPTWMEDHR